jgi:hypothetical protein
VNPGTVLVGTPIGLTLAEGKTILATVQARLVDAQAAAYWGAKPRPSKLLGIVVDQ